MHAFDFILVLFSFVYLNARLVSPRIPETGEIDLQRFHSEESRKYLIAYTILCVITVVTNARLGHRPAPCSGRRRISLSFR